MAKLVAGDTIAYTAKFLKSTGQFTGNAPMRRGTYIRPCPEMGAQFARVRWHDMDYATYDGDGHGADYAENIREKGSIVNASIIAKVGSAKFALNDL